MKNKIIILFDYPNKDLNIKIAIRKKLKNNFLNAKTDLKNFSKVFIYKSRFNKNFKKDIPKKKTLNQIKNYYNRLDINISLEKIFDINFFLEKIKSQNKKEKIFISPYSMFHTGYSEEAIIFYELSKIYNMQFLKPERSFIKNRYILAKNIYRHPYILKKKTNFSKNKFNAFKRNYTLAIENFSKNIKKTNHESNVSFFYKISLFILRLIFNFRFQEIPKKYALVILNNSIKLSSISEFIKLKKFVKRFHQNFKYELVFLIHPSVNVFKFLFNHIKKKDIFFNNNRTFFLQKPGNLNEIISKSKFIAHTSSSLSPQLIFFEKKILCLGRNIPYINLSNNLISNFEKNGFKNLKKKAEIKDQLEIDKFLNSVLTNSVDHRGDFYLEVNKDHYSSAIKITKTRENIVQNLLNSV